MILCTQSICEVVKNIFDPLFPLNTSIRVEKGVHWFLCVFVSVYTSGPRCSVVSALLTAKNLQKTFVFAAFLNQIQVKMIYCLSTRAHAIFNCILGLYLFKSLLVLFFNVPYLLCFTAISKMWHNCIHKVVISIPVLQESTVCSAVHVKPGGFVRMHAGFQDFFQFSS